MGEEHSQRTELNSLMKFHLDLPCLDCSESESPVTGLQMSCRAPRYPEKVLKRPGSRGGVPGLGLSPHRVPQGGWDPGWMWDFQRPSKRKTMCFPFVWRILAELTVRWLQLVKLNKQTVFN